MPKTVVAVVMSIALSRFFSRLDDRRPEVNLASGLDSDEIEQHNRIVDDRTRQEDNSQHRIDIEGLASCQQSA
jgi:hypothetical protein